MIAAIYARKSTEQNGVADAEKSVTRQIDHAKEYAVGKGWTVADAHIYQDDGVSGAEFKTRPGFLRLMNALSPKPPFQVLIMSEESRLGREAIETAYALKQLVTAGVRVFFYLEDRERTLDGPMDKVMLSLTTFADELEREKARQRTYDAMSRKAKAGQVTGGRVFGYDNVEVLGEPDSQGRRTRLHVRRVINEREAAVVRQIFELSAGGHGQSRIAKLLNGNGALAPRAQRGRPQSWAPSSVHEVLHRPLYRGEIVWNRSRKRDTWGQTRQHARPEDEWVRREALELRIVDEPLWQAAHARLGEKRARYLAATGGQRWGRRSDVDSKYLLVGFARCACCGGGLCVRSRSQGGHRAFRYGCTAYWKRGRTVCSNGLELRMGAADDAVLSSLAGDVLAPDVVDEVVAGVLAVLAPKAGRNERAALAGELEQLEAESARLVDAIAVGGDLAPLVDRLKLCQARQKAVQAQLTGRVGAQPARIDRRYLERAVRAKVEDWRGLLTRQVTYGRDLLRQALEGPIVFTPVADGNRRGYRFDGTVAIDRLLSGVIDLPTGLASQGTPSWNQIAVFLEAMRGLRDSVGFAA